MKCVTNLPLSQCYFLSSTVICLTRSTSVTSHCRSATSALPAYPVVVLTVDPGSEEPVLVLPVVVLEAEEGLDEVEAQKRLTEDEDLKMKGQG